MSCSRVSETFVIAFVRFNLRTETAAVVQRVKSPSDRNSVEISKLIFLNQFKVKLELLRMNT